MIKKQLLLVLVSLILGSVIVFGAYYPEPWSGDVEAGGYNLTNGGVITADLFIGDGSQLSGITANINTTVLNWTALQNYPSACPANTYVTTIDDTITCTSVNNVSNFVFSGNVINFTGAGQSPVIDVSVASSDISVLKPFNLRNNTLKGGKFEVLPNQTCIMLGASNNTGFFWQNQDMAGRLSICNPGAFPTTGGIGTVAWLSDVYANSVSYGASLTAGVPSLLDGGGFGLSLKNDNASAQTSFRLASPGDGNANSAIQVFLLGVNDTSLEGPFGQHADSTLLILDAARQNRLAVSYGKNLTINIGDGGGNFASADQVLFGSDRVQVSPNVLLQLQTNSTAITCSGANAGSIIFSGVGFYGCNSTDWVGFQ